MTALKEHGSLNPRCAHDCIYMVFAEVAVIRETVVKVDVIAVCTFRCCRVAQFSVRVGTCVLEILYALYVRIVVVVGESIIGTGLLRHEHVEGIERDSQVGLQPWCNRTEVARYVQCRVEVTATVSVTSS